MNRVKHSPIPIAIFMFAACAQEPESTIAADADREGFGCAVDGGISDALPNTDDERRASFWMRRWEGSSDGITVVLDVNTFTYSEAAGSATLTGLASALPCVGKVEIAQASVFFGNSFTAVANPAVNVQSNIPGKGALTNGFFFNGKLDEAERLEVVLSFKAFGSEVSPQCKVMSLPMVLTPSPN